MSSDDKRSQQEAEALQKEQKEKLDAHLRNLEQVESVVDENVGTLDYPVPETKKDKFFRIMDLFGEMVFLNICFVVASLPIITIGAAMTALYRIMMKMVRREEGQAVKSFWQYFKEDFGAATKVWLVILAILGAIYGEYCYMVLYAQDKMVPIVVLIGFELVVLSFILPLLFPLVARYQNTAFSYIENSLMLSAGRPGVWLRVFVSWMAPILLSFSYPKVLYYAWFVWLFLLVSLLTYSNSIVLRKLFDELEQRQAQTASQTDRTAKSSEDKKKEKKTEETGEKNTEKKRKSE